ncbi:hypothetical protein ACQ4PT_022936 [Festuca glaucescens]
MESVQQPGASPLPVLVQDVGTQTDDEPLTQYSISSKALSPVAFDELRRYRCFVTPQGWVLALDPTSCQTFLWRPQDGERIQLPPKEQGFPESCKCLLSDMPGAASGCSVVVFDLDDNEMWVCKIGATNWDSHRYEPNMFVKGRIPQLTNIAKCHGIAAVGGRIYFELTAREMGVIEFNGKEGLKLDTIEVDMVDLPLSIRMASMYLVESSGELFLVVIFFDGENVHKIANHAVYKMDFSEPKWCEVDEIGADKVFLLGGDRLGISCFGASCSSRDHGLRGNCIYFLNHVPTTTKSYLHVIDLKTGTEEAQRPFITHNGYHMMPVRSPFWLLPTESTLQAQGSSVLPSSPMPPTRRSLVTLLCIFFFVFRFLAMY